MTLEFLGFIALVELWDTMNNFAYVLLFLCERKRGAHTENWTKKIQRDEVKLQRQIQVSNSKNHPFVASAIHPVKNVLFAVSQPVDPS